ncbi:hypothetical protein QVD17_10534 [Tagetes erecta]|uniref:B box-type domain-containing protein n=1 Tax=Tagetes erecta TaxID=13708 RepID=A0AAD8P6D8_TARER|nr:hypothetical protein QVD17_10534 [Tagetes erecta]
MKIICDVCNNDEASLFCPADDAALCSACDHRVHRANNLAGKHPRFPLLLPSPKDSPLCDICQEEKAMLFCHEDRAILCKNCDVNIHKVNEHKMNHCRFLLTGIKLSPVALLSKSGDEEPISVKKPVAVAVSASVVNQTQKIITVGAPKLNGSGYGCLGGSSISEYLIETLPGWHVEDLLDSPPTYSKVDEDDPGMFWDDEILNVSMNDCLSQEKMGIWVPQAPPPAAPPPSQPLLLNSYQVQPFSNMGFGSQMISGSSPFFDPTDLNKIAKPIGKRGFEDGDYFTVPQINSPVTMNFKRSRTNIR